MKPLLAPLTMKRFGIFAILALFVAAPAWAQGTIQQSGPVTPFHAGSWQGNGVQADAGTPAAPALDALGLFDGANCPLGVSSQTTPGVSTSPYSQFSVCQTPTTTTLTLTGVNGEPTPALVFNIGGTLYPFPGPGGGTVNGPGSSVVGHVACWNNTIGTLLEDCGPFPSGGGSSHLPLASVQFSDGAGGFLGTGNVKIRGPSSPQDQRGLYVAGLDLNVLSSSGDEFGLGANCQNDGLGVGGGGGLGFPDANCTTIGFLAWGGYASYGGLNFTKTTNIGVNTQTQTVGSGQAFGYTDTVFKSGASDVSALTLAVVGFNNKTVAGDEGVGITELSPLAQQTQEAYSTIVSIPSQSTCWAYVTAPLTGDTTITQTASVVTVSGACNSTTPWVVLNPSPGIPVPNKCAMAITAATSNSITGVYCSNMASGTFTGSISGTTLTATGSPTATLGAGEAVIGAGITAKTVITNQLGGTPGGAGTYSVSISQTVGSETITVGSAIIPAFVATLSTLAFVAPDLPVIDTTLPSHTAGSVTGISGAFNIAFTGASLSPTIVGGSAMNPGCIDLHADDQTAFGPEHAWFEVQAITGAGAAQGTTLSTAGNQTYNGNSPTGGATYTLAPCLEVLRIPNGPFPATLAVFDADPGFGFQVGDSLTFAVGQYPDVHGIVINQTIVTPGATTRGAYMAANTGIVPGDGVDLQDKRAAVDSGLPWAFVNGLACTNCELGINLIGPQDGMSINGVSRNGVVIVGLGSSSGIGVEIGNMNKGITIANISGADLTLGDIAPGDALVTSTGGAVIGVVGVTKTCTVLPTVVTGVITAC